MSAQEQQYAARLAEVSGRRTAINAMANYGRAAVVLVLGLFLQAYLVRTLGTAQYALWPVVGSCVAFAALIPRGIGAGVGRFIAHALGDNRLDEIERITTSVFISLSGAALLYGLVVIGLSLGFEHLFEIPEGAEGIGPWTMLFAGLAGAVAVPMSVFQGGLTAAQQFVKINLLRTSMYAARVGLIVLGLTFGGASLIWVGLAFLVIACFDSAVLVILARRVLPWQRVRRRSFDRAVLGRVTTFSVWVLFSAVAGLLYWHTDTLIINKLLDPTLVAGYAIVVSLSLSAYQFVTLGCQALAPAMTVMHAQGDIDRMVQAIYRTNRAIVPLGILPVVFAMIFGEEILVLYVGEGFREFGVLFWLVGGAWVTCATNQVSNSVPVAFGEMKLASLGAFTAAWVNVALSLLFVVVFEWGLLGVAGGTVVTWVIYKLGFWSWLVAGMLEVPLGRFMARATIRPFALAAPGICCLVAARWLGLGDGLWALLLIAAVAGAVQLGFMLVVGLDPADRATAWRMLRRLRRR